MEKTKIDWCDSTWNPVTGCLHECGYCYARGIANRFSGGGEKWTDNNLFVLDEKFYVEESEKACPYPYGFKPTFHKYRLDEYANKKGRNIFVCSMADLFGNWVPEEWQREVFLACTKAMQHNYLFLTKAPENIPGSSYLYTGNFTRHPDNMWFGTTITSQMDLEKRYFPLLQTQGHVFLSIEPLLAPLDLNNIEREDGQVYFSIGKKMAYYFGGGQKYRVPEWIIIGAETGNRKEKVVPKRKWVEDIVNICREAEIPVFMKESLSEIWGEKLLQEYPKVQLM